MERSKLTFCIVYHMLMVVACEKDAHDVTTEIKLVGSSNQLPDGFVDPHSFHYDRVSKQMIIDEPDEKGLELKTVDTAQSNCHHELEQCRDALSNRKPDDIFTRRLVNLLLSNAALKEEDYVTKGSLFLYATASQMEMLRKFGDGKLSARQVDSILSDVIRPPPTDILMEAITYTELLFGTVYQHGRLCAAVLATLFVLFIIIRMRWTTGKVIMVFLAIVFLTSFMITFWKHVKEAEIKHFATTMKYKDMPIQCQPDKMSWWQKFVALYGEDECEKYYNAVMMDPMLHVTPINALSHVLAKSVLDPVVLCGEAIGDFIAKSTDNLWFPTRWVVTILMYLAVVMVIMLMPLCIFGGSFGFGPFFRISLGRERQSANRQATAISQEREPITVILKVTHEGTINQMEPSKMVQNVQENSLALAGGDHKYQDANRPKEISGPQSDALSDKVILQRVEVSNPPTRRSRNLKKQKKHESENDGGDSC